MSLFRSEESHCVSVPVRRGCRHSVGSRGGALGGGTHSTSSEQPLQRDTHSLDSCGLGNVATETGLLVVCQ